MLKFALLCQLHNVDYLICMLVLGRYFDENDFSYAYDFVYLMTNGDEFVSDALLDCFLDCMYSEISKHIETLLTSPNPIYENNI